MSNYIVSVVEGFETEEFSELISKMIKDGLHTPSQGLINLECFSRLNNKNKLNLFKLIVECYQYFDEKDCDDRTQLVIYSFINKLSFMNDAYDREKTHKDINKIINEFRQCKDGKFIKDFINATSNRINFILNKSQMHMNLCFGVAELLDKGHKVSFEMENIIEDFLKNHPEHWEHISRGRLGIHIHDNDYKYQSIKKTKRYFKNKFDENPNDEVYKIFYELFEIFVENGIEI